MKIGDILVCSWGATMRLYDFFEVKIFTDKTVTLQMLKKSSEGGPMWESGVKPIPNQYDGVPFNRRMKDGYSKGYFSSQLIHLNDVWDGKEVFFENHMD